MKWDQYFLAICKAVASKSPCLSVQRGAILVRDKSIVATGFNGPARGVPHCGHERFMKDKSLSEEFRSDMYAAYREEIKTRCPRRILGYPSGKGLHLCTAEHAERNTIANAARLGVSTLGSTLYMDCETPCKNCLTLLINAGIVEIVVTSTKLYDEGAKFIIDNSDIKIREFEL